MAIIDAAAIPFSVPAIVLSLLISSLFLKIFTQFWRFRHIPGPFQAKLTNFWLSWKFWTRESFLDISLDLTKRYGPVVQYGPNRVMFSDVSAVGVIFNTKDALPKADSYDAAAPVINGNVMTTMLTERNEAQVAAIKKQIISAFTTNAILDYESHIDYNIKYLMSQLAGGEVNREKLNIAPWIAFFAFDTICRIAFSDDQGLMKKRTDMNNAMATARIRLAHWHAWRWLPWLEKLIYKNGWAKARSRANPKGSLLGQLAAARLQDRVQKDGSETFSDLLDRFLQAGQREPKLFTNATIFGLVISIVNAGADTTSSTISTTLYYLMSNPRTMRKLRQEIAAAKLSSPPLWREVNPLPYLDACIKEASRLSPLFFDPLEREVPASGPGVEISGVYIPPGSIVCVNQHTLNRDPAVWGDAVDEFRPERWIEARDEQAMQRMERANMAFGKGRRVCIGQHIAWIEMKKLIPELLTRFDIELANPDEPLNIPCETMVLVEELLVRLTPR